MIEMIALETSFLIEERSTADANACHDFCKNVPDCQWFTFHSNLLLCLALASCNELNSVNYPVRMPTVNVKMIAPLWFEECI
jgi:hypothetical protein